MSQYATVPDLLDRFDPRTVCDFASDDDEPIDVGDLVTDSRVIAALDDASAQIDAACQYGRRYARDVLVGLSIDVDRQKGALIRYICCDLAMRFLVGRRLAPGAEITSLIPGLAASLKWLDRLHNGDAVLDYDPAVTETLPYNTGPLATDPSRPTFYNPMFGTWPQRTW